MPHELDELILDEYKLDEEELEDELTTMKAQKGMALVGACMCNALFMVLLCQLQVKSMETTTTESFACVYQYDPPTKKFELSQKKR